MVGDNIRPALRTGQHVVSLIIVLESFFLWIPIHFSFQSHGNLVNQTSRAGTMAYLNWRNRRLTCLHALQPVAMMFFAFIQVNFLWPDHRSNNLRITGSESLTVLKFRCRVAGRHSLVTTRDEDPSLRPFKFDPVRQLSTNHHFYTAGVQCLGLKLT